MKYDNVTYLIFDKNGEMKDDNVISHGNFEFEFDLFGMQIRDGNIGMSISKDAVVSIGGIESYSIKVKHCTVGSREYCFMSVINSDFIYSAITYHSELNSIGWEFFHEFAEFFLPEREPLCCCKNRYNKILLPYVNKVLKSMVKHFNLEEYYGNCEYTKNMTLSSKLTKEICYKTTEGD